MIAPPRVRNLALTAHVTCSVGWLGGVAAYLALAIAALVDGDSGMVRAAYVSMEPMAWFAIVPLALATLATGLVMSLVTTWGLIRHYWVLAKLVLAVLATIVLLSHMSTVVSLADMAAGDTGIDSGGLRGEIVHAGGGLLVLLVATVLSVHKPRGMTPYERRRQASKELDRAPTPAPGRWIVASALIAVTLVLIFVILHMTGVHTRH